MADSKMHPAAVLALEVPPRQSTTIYPQPLAQRVLGREKRALGDIFGLRNFGVNLTRLAPGAVSSLRHTHSKQDEFVYVLQGQAVLRTDQGTVTLSPGMCAGFRAGSGDAHHLVNETEHDVLYIEVGDRTPGDQPTYPDDDLRLVEVDGRRRVAHKDGRLY